MNSLQFTAAGTPWRLIDTFSLLDELASADTVVDMLAAACYHPVGTQRFLKLSIMQQSLPRQVRVQQVMQQQQVIQQQQAVASGTRVMSHN
jgi:hypothetical protein